MIDGDILQKHRLLIIGGTHDCHEFLSRFKDYNLDICVTVATQSGKEFLSYNNIDIVVGKLDRDGFAKIIVEKNIDFILDSSHPYAYEVTDNVSNVCQKLGLPYIRYLRPSLDADCVLNASNADLAADMLNNMDGNIFLTTGSKDLHVYTQKIQNYKKRLFVRIIPALESIKICKNLGIPISNIIATSGIFSVQMNIEMMKHFDAKILVTKDSGKAGGFEQKIKAAQTLNLKIIVIKRHAESVQSISDYDSVVKIVVKSLNLERAI